MKTWLAGWLAVSVMAVSVPAMAGTPVPVAEGDSTSVTYAAGNQSTVKVDSIQDRISKLRTEVAKGTSVYSASELRILELKLNDAQDLLSVLTHGG